MNRLLKTMFTDMDLYKALILLQAVAIIGLGGFFGKQFFRKMEIEDELDAHRTAVDYQMLPMHKKMRGLITKVAGDEFQSTGQGELVDYVRDSVFKAGLTDVTSGRVQIQQVGKGLEDQVIPFSFPDANTKPVSRTLYPEFAGRGGFTQSEIMRLLYQIEKRTYSVRVKQLKLVPFDTDKPNNPKLDRAKANTKWRWSIDNLRVMSRRNKNAES